MAQERHPALTIERLGNMPFDGARGIILMGMDTADFQVNFQVSKYVVGKGSTGSLRRMAESVEIRQDAGLIFVIDSFFSKNQEVIDSLALGPKDILLPHDSSTEPTTDYLNTLRDTVHDHLTQMPGAVIGLGGGGSLDTAKALSNLLTNDGPAEEYQGWDLLPKPGIPKIGIPTLPGTGAESSKTCVLTNPRSGLKLGMNSPYTLFDLVILDTNFSASVPKDLLFISSSDTFFHSIEALNGSFRNPVADAYFHQALNLVSGVYESRDIAADANREALMVSSFISGSALSAGIVGLIHPFSAGLSVVLGIPHTVANCIVMGAMEEFYPKEFSDFWSWVEKHEIDIPTGVCADLTEEQFTALYASTIVHSKPLANHLGDSFHDVLNESKIRKMFEEM